MSKIWVVEMFVEGSWVPVKGIEICRSEAREEKRQWEEECNGDRFRIRRYVRDTNSRG